MAVSSSYRDLVVWQVGMDVVVDVYAMTRRLPGEERHVLTEQVRRAAISIPANIAEGRARPHLPVYLQHLAVAQGSLAELETHLLIAVRTGMLRETTVAPLLDKLGSLGRMLQTLRRRLKDRTAQKSQRKGSGT